MRCCGRAKAILLIKQLGKLVLEVVDQVVIPNVLRSAFPLMSFMLTSVVCILVVFNYLDVSEHCISVSLVKHVCLLS